jgi:hypothetical protein
MNMVTDRGSGSISKVEVHWPKEALLYTTKIKQFYFVHEPNENFKKLNVYNVGNDLYRVFTTAERALSFQKNRAFIQKILFSFLANLNGAL